MIIEFDFARGHMTIDLNKFLPTSQKRVRRLFKFMTPNLTELQKIMIENWFIEKQEADSTGKYGKYLEIFRRSL